MRGADKQDRARQEAGRASLILDVAARKAPRPSTAYQAPTIIRTAMVRHETQAIVAVYNSGVFIVASRAACKQSLSAAYQAPTAIKTTMLITSRQRIVAGTVSQSGVIVASRAVIAELKPDGSGQIMN
jgi:hypothetical protein